MLSLDMADLPRGANHMHFHMHFPFALCLALSLSDPN